MSLVKCNVCKEMKEDDYEFICHDCVAKWKEVLIKKERERILNLIDCIQVNQGEVIADRNFNKDDSYSGYGKALLESLKKKITPKHKEVKNGS